MGWLLDCRALFRTLGMGVYVPNLSVACAEGSCGCGEVGSHRRSILLQDCTVQEGGRNWRWRSGGNRSKRFFNSFTHLFSLIRDFGHLATLR